MDFWNILWVFSWSWRLGMPSSIRRLSIGVRYLTWWCWLHSQLLILPSCMAIWNLLWILLLRLRMLVWGIWIRWSDRICSSEWICWLQYWYQWRTVLGWYSILENGLILYDELRRTSSYVCRALTMGHYLLQLFRSRFEFRRIWTSCLRRSRFSLSIGNSKSLSRHFCYIYRISTIRMARILRCWQLCWTKINHAQLRIQRIYNTILVLCHCWRYELSRWWC